MHRSVPKFSSFRSKAGTRSYDQTATPIANSSDRQPEHDTGHRSEGEASQGLRSSAEAIHTRGLWHGSKQIEDRSTLLQGASSDTLPFYVIDRTGDSNNPIYGSNPSDIVPRFYSSLKGECSILGTVQASHLDRHANKYSLSKPSRGLRRALHSDGQYAKADACLVEHMHESITDNFIPFNSSKEHKGNSKAKDREALVHVANAESEVPENISSDSEWSASAGQDHCNGASESDGGADYRKRNMLLRQRIEKAPQDVHSWLDLIDFQNLWIRHAFNSGSGPGPGEDRSVAEVRISLYADALDRIHHKRDGREMLLLGMLQEGELVWTTEKLISNWNNVIASNRASLDIRLKFIDLIQTTPSCFAHEFCLDQYKIYLDLISKDAELSQYERDFRQIHALVRLTCYLRDAEFNELAVSVWQSMLEFMCFPPDGTDHTGLETLESFEKYWEDRQLRIGEDGSPGWHRHPEMSVSNPATRSGESQLTSPITTNEPVSVWLKKEQDSRFKSLLPLRSDSFDQDDDPYRVVLFEDIKPFIVDISVKNNRSLIDGFLCWCQLPPLPYLSGNGTCTTHELWQDAFLRPYQLEDCTSLSDNALSNTVTSTETLFYSTNKYFMLFSSGSNFFQKRMGKFVRNVLHALVERMPNDTGLALYFLGFLFAIEPLEARKAAKAILKQNSSNLVVYNAYGLLESLLGNHNAANYVFSNAIKMADSISSAERLSIVLLQRTWIWEILRNSGAEQASIKLREVIAADGDMIEHKVSSIRVQAMQYSLPQVAALASELLALKSYLLSSTRHGDLQAALKTFSDQFEEYSVISQNAQYPLELLHQAQAQLVQYHIENHKVYSARQVRETMRSSVRAFPSNTLILSAFTCNERLFEVANLQNPVIREISHAVGSQTIVSWLFALKLQIEKCRRSSGSETLYSIRLLFQKAVSNDSVGKHSVALWTAYLHWEIQAQSYGGIAAHEHYNATKQSSDMARQVWLTGLTRLPWIKRYYVLGILLLRPRLTLAECLGYAGLISDRGLRLYNELEVAS